MMIDLLEDLKRTDYCGDLRRMDVDRAVTLLGWVQRRRDLGGLIFVELRDRQGIVQVVFNPALNREVHEKAQSLRSEFVVGVKGRVVIRPEGTSNPKLKTGLPIAGVTADYQTLLMKTMRLHASLRKQINVLQHLLGFFKRQLSADEKREALELIELYGRGSVPLIVPITLMNHYVRKYAEPYLSRQYYLQPHPVELQLRNHA